MDFNNVTFLILTRASIKLDGLHQIYNFKPQNHLTTSI